MPQQSPFGKRVTETPADLTHETWATVLRDRGWPVVPREEFLRAHGLLLPEFLTMDAVELVDRLRGNRADSDDLPF